MMVQQAAQHGGMVQRSNENAGFMPMQQMGFRTQMPPQQMMHGNGGLQPGVLQPSHKHNLLGVSHQAARCHFILPKQLLHGPSARRITWAILGRKCNACYPLCRARQRKCILWV